MAYSARAGACLAAGFAWAFTAVAAGAAPLSTPLADAVAVVTAVHGAAWLLRDGQQIAVPGLAMLAPDDALRLEARASLELVTLAGGGHAWMLAGAGHYQVRKEGVRARGPDASVRALELGAAWRGLHLAPERLARAAAALRGAASTPLEMRYPLGPVRGETLVDLRWARPYGRASAAWAYAVQLVGPEGEVIARQSTAAESVRLPAGFTWQRGRPYAWTVEAVADDGRRAEASAEFTVTEVPGAARLRELARACDDARAHGHGRIGAEEVLFVLALAAAGLPAEALDRWQALEAR